MKLGYTVWTWMLEEFDRGEHLTESAKAHFEEAVRSISHLGYDVLENFNFVIFLYENNLDEFKALLKKYDLPLACLYHTYLGKEKMSEEYFYELGERTCKVLKEMGGSYLNLQPAMWSEQPFARSTDYAMLDRYVKLFSNMGKIAARYGVQACVHPHAQTHIFREHEIDYFVEHMDKSVLKTLSGLRAHTTLAGMDAVKAFDKYGDLLGYVHIKDVNPDEHFDDECRCTRLHALGQGTVDLQGVLRLFEEARLRWHRLRRGGLSADLQLRNGAVLPQLLPRRASSLIAAA